MDHCCKKTKNGLLVSWPPRDKGPGKLFRVVYVIDIDAADRRQAAQQAYHLMSDPDSMKPVLYVMTPTGASSMIDLSEVRSRPKERS